MSDVKTVFHNNGDGFIIERKQDVEDILKSNIEDAKENKQDTLFGRRVASIPNIVVEQWLKEGINIYNMGHDPDVRRKVLLRLNSPEWKHLRTHNSRL